MEGAPRGRARQHRRRARGRRRRSRRRQHGRADGADAAPRRVAVRAAGAGLTRVDDRPDPVDADRDRDRARTPRRHQLLLVASPADPCPGAHDSRRGVPGGRRLGAHGRGRRLGVRHMASPPRRQPRGGGADPPRGRHRRRRRAVGPHRSPRARRSDDRADRSRRAGSAARALELARGDGTRRGRADARRAVR